MWSWLADRKVRRVSLCRFAWFSIGIIFGYQKRVRVFDHLVATFVWPHVFWVSGEHVVTCLDLLSQHSRVNILFWVLQSGGRLLLI